MKSPIALIIPHYYDSISVEGNRMIFMKSKSLFPQDASFGKFIASIEEIANYECSILEIDKDYQGLATKIFEKERDRDWAMPQNISGCKVYSYNWADKTIEFRIFWIIISETHMLQLVGIFAPAFASFYKNNFIRFAFETQIDSNFDFSHIQNPAEFFRFAFREIDLEDLEELIKIEAEKAAALAYLAENLKISNPNFFSVLESELNHNQSATIESFMCKDWNLFYDLHNPENFSNPDSTIEWESNEGLFDFFSEPKTDNTKTQIESLKKKCDLSELKHLIETHEIVEQKILSFFEHYTFDNGGAYAAGIHFEYAKIEIERLQKASYTKPEFLKRNLYLESIILPKNTFEIQLDFKCSWDTEHGITICLDRNLENIRSLN